jgi:soluble P-type ATPase
MVKEVQMVENQLHNMVNIFINSIDRECFGSITTSLSI